MMIPRSLSQLEDIQALHLLASDVRSSATSPSMDEMLTPVDRLADETVSLDFTAVLELLSNAYNKKLDTLRQAENEALSKFHSTYENYLKQRCGALDINNTGEEHFQDNIGTNASNFQLEPWQAESSVSNDITDITYDKTFSHPTATSYKKLEKLFPEVLRRDIKPRELWQKEITVPEPFQMTLRENEKKCKRKSNTNLNKDIKEFNFHSNPVPAHVYLPMYKVISEQSKNLREERIETRKQKLLAEVKPFHLSYETRSQTNPLRRSQSLTNISAAKFTASSFPHHIFNQFAKNEKVIEDCLRQIRIKSRAEEMMKQSALPFTGQKIISRWHSFGSLHDKKQFPMEKRDFAKKRNEQFYPETSGNSYKKVNIHRENRHKNCINTDQFLYKPNIDQKNSHLRREKAPNYKSTKTSLLREERKKKQKEMEKEIKEQNDQDLSNRLSCQSYFKREVALRVKMNNHLPASHDTIKAKLVAYRISQQNRVQEYAQELTDMKERLKKRPLLIEQQVQHASRSAAIKHIQSGKFLVHGSDFEQRRDSNQSTSDASQVKEDTTYSDSREDLRSVSPSIATNTQENEESAVNEETYENSMQSSMDEEETDS